MTRDEIRAVVDEELSNVAPETSPALIDDKVDLREALDIDSVGFLTFVTALYKRLNVNVPEKDYPKLFTKQRAIDYLSARLPAATGTSRE
jgi:acyl carrier protein